MPRSTRGPRPASSATEDRKAIEQRARDAAVPFAPEKKGHWPFPIDDRDGGDGSQEADNAGDRHNAGDRRIAGNRNGNTPSVQGSPADQ